MTIEPDSFDLVENSDRLHSTKMGIDRIRTNLELDAKGKIGMSTPIHE